MKLCLNKAHDNHGRYFIRHSDIEVVWLENSDGREYCISTFGKAYEIYQMDKGLLTEAGALYVQHIGDRRRFWHDVSKIKIKE